MCIQGFGGKRERRRLLGRPRHRWEGNIKMNIKEMILETWTELM